MDTLDVCATRTLECGVEPIEIGLRPFYDCYYSNTVGYRGRVYINSILYGVLSQEECASALEHDAVGAELAVRNMRAVARTLPRFSDDAARLELISMPCPAVLTENEALYDTLRAVGRGIPPKLTRKLCMEFRADVLRGDSGRLRQAFTDIRAAGWKIAVDGYGTRYFPMTALAETPPDAVYLCPEAVRLLDDRERAASVGAYVSFAQSLGVRVIADGAATDGQVRELSSRECFAYMPSPDYCGSAAVVSRETDLRMLTVTVGDSRAE